MPFETVLIVLGASFVSAWAFIGGMLVRDSIDRARTLRFDDSANGLHPRIRMPARK